MEFLDNVVNHVPIPPGTIGGSGFGVRPCVRNYTIRGNAFYECRSAIGVDGLSSGGCHARRCDNIVIDQNIFGQASGTTTLSGAVNKTTLVSAIELLNDNNAPQTDRVLVTNPAGYSDLLNTSDFVRADSISGANASWQAA